MVYDGELLVVDKSGVMNRKTGNGILNKAVKGTISKKEAQLVQAILWDMIPLNDFQNGKCNTPYVERLLDLGGLLLRNGSDIARLKMVSTEKVASLEEAQKICQQYLEAGEEGIILKDANAPWEAKRVKTQIEFKGELECDLSSIS